MRKMWLPYGIRFRQLLFPLGHLSFHCRASKQARERVETATRSCLSHLKGLQGLSPVLRTGPKPGCQSSMSPGPCPLLQPSLPWVTTLALATLDSSPQSGHVLLCLCILVLVSLLITSLQAHVDLLCILQGSDHLCEEAWGLAWLRTQ